MCMSRTNIDLDDELVEIVMNRFSLPTKKSAVEMALRRLVEETDQMKLIEVFTGLGADSGDGVKAQDDRSTARALGPGLFRQSTQRGQLVPERTAPFARRACTL